MFAITATHSSDITTLHDITMPVPPTNGFRLEEALSIICIDEDYLAAAAAGGGGGAALVVVWWWTHPHMIM
jgi:hypothetical protein